ncbi:MAG: DUF167 domain-containing protein [Candidatus Omnitrophica bacterium]|nr:DUF167 domain-containing protein [Candidatus Omnitrophota bacterium]
MKISVKVKARAREEKVEKIEEGNFRVLVKAEAKEGKANQAVIELLSRYFDIPKSRITILKGHSSKNKILQLI